MENHEQSENGQISEHPKRLFFIQLVIFCARLHIRAESIFKLYELRLLNVVLGRDQHSNDKKEYLEMHERVVLCCYNSI